MYYWVFDETNVLQNFFSLYSWPFLFMEKLLKNTRFKFEWTSVYYSFTLWFVSLFKEYLSTEMTKLYFFTFDMYIHNFAVINFYVWCEVFFFLLLTWISNCHSIISEKKSFPNSNSLSLLLNLNPVYIHIKRIWGANNSVPSNILKPLYRLYQKSSYLLWCYRHCLIKTKTLISLLKIDNIRFFNKASNRISIFLIGFRP